jgi:hypothetical protein
VIGRLLCAERRCDARGTTQHHDVPNRFHHLIIRSAIGSEWLSLH